MCELHLILVTQEMKVAFSQSLAAFGRTVGLTVPTDWPEFPEAFALSDDAADPLWGGYLFAFAGGIVGNGGFAGAPDASGAVEIGYEIGPAYRNRGYATAAAPRLIERAFHHSAASVIAHSAAEWNASNRVMMKAGMRFVEVVPNEELGSAWRFAVSYDEWARTR